MKDPLRIAANLVSIVALAALLLLPTSKYEWIETVDPSFAASELEDAGGNRIVVVGLLLAFVLGIQLTLLARTSDKKQRVAAAAFAVVAIIVCVTKFKQ